MPVLRSVFGGKWAERVILATRLVRLGCLGLHEGRELLEHPVHLIRRVVVAEPDPDRTARVLQPEPLHDLEGVVVAVPHEDPALGEPLRGLGGRLLSHADGKRGRALARALRPVSYTHLTLPTS